MIIATPRILPPKKGRPLSTRGQPTLLAGVREDHAQLKFSAGSAYYRVFANSSGEIALRPWRPPALPADFPRTWRVIRQSGCCSRRALLDETTKASVLDEGSTPDFRCAQNTARDQSPCCRGTDVGSVARLPDRVKLARRGCRNFMRAYSLGAHDSPSDTTRRNHIGS